MISRTGKDFDIILITAEFYDDHPLSPAGVIARVLDAKGYDVGIIEKPAIKEDYEKLGRPKLFFAVTSGSIDSMLNNYTPLKKKRALDLHSKMKEMPDRAVIFYCNKIREYMKNSIIVIGGIEASLRRFAHYDYWDNKIRKSILFDSRADILVYGNGEKQILEIAKHIKEGKDIIGIAGTCIISKSVPDDFIILPSFDEVATNYTEFCKMQVQFSNQINLSQRHGKSNVLQYSYPKYSTKDLDWIYGLPFSRTLNPASFLKMAKFSVVTHRGCIGRCNFCSISLHQGDKIISRSEESILAEIKRLTSHPEFKGYIDDLGGPSANMYGMDCDVHCTKSCIKCAKLDKSHSKLIILLKKARQIQGIKKIYVRSGIRYDLAIESKEYIGELIEHHISGCLKIAPEHVSPAVLKLMNKDSKAFQEFISCFDGLNREKKQELRYYFMIGHPGEDENSIDMLKNRLKILKNTEQFQLFTPTPMTVSTCMYWTGLNPYTNAKVSVIHDYNTKKNIKRKIITSIK